MYIATRRARLEARGAGFLVLYNSEKRTLVKITGFQNREGVYLS